MSQSSFQDVEQVLTGLHFPPFEPRAPHIQGMIELVKGYNYNSDFQSLSSMVDVLERTLSILSKETALELFTKIRAKMEREKVVAETCIELLSGLEEQ